MNPIEILEILAIAVHSFREMLGLGQTPDSSDVGSQCSPVQSAARQPAAYSDQSNIDKTEEKSEKITRAALQVIVSWPAPSSRSPLANWACFYVVLSRPRDGGHNIYHNILRSLSAKHSGITSSLDKF